MKTDLPQNHAYDLNHPVIAWLLDGDPAIRWQVMQDVLHAPAAAVAAERAKVAAEGMGTQLLALQGADGRWAGAAWNHGWNSTMHVLTLLKEMGLDPQSEPAQSALRLVRDFVTWKGCGPEECDDNLFFAGELEPCINGQVGAAGAYFGQDVWGIVGRLLGEQLSDGGWNCEAENGSRRASFHTTICVLEALLEVELSFGSNPEVKNARQRGEEYLLERHLFQRLSTGEPIYFDRKTGQAGPDDQPAFTQLAFPTWWHYDILRGLEYLRHAGAVPDARMAEAIEVLASKQGADGRWQMEIEYPGVMPIKMDAGMGQPSRWITLRALRVLDWYSKLG